MVFAVEGGGPGRCLGRVVDRVLDRLREANNPVIVMGSSRRKESIAEQQGDASTDRDNTFTNAIHGNRVCIVGCGNVGMATAFALIQSGLIRELVLVGRDHDRTEGEVMDLQHAVAVPMAGQDINNESGSGASHGRRCKPLTFVNLKGVLQESLSNAGWGQL